MVILIKQLDHTPIGDRYNVTFFNKRITTIVTSNSRVVTKWISDIENNQRTYLDQLIVGFDIKYSLHWANTRVATLQLCIGNKCLIYQLMHVGATSDYFPISLIRFLSNPAYTFVGVNICYQVTRLRQFWGLGVNAFVVELGVLASTKLHHRKDLRYAPLERVARFVLPTSHTYNTPFEVMMSNWEDRQLTDIQVKWACVDAFAAFKVGLHLDAFDWQSTPSGDVIRR